MKIRSFDDVELKFRHDVSVQRQMLGYLQKYPDDKKVKDIYKEYSLLLYILWEREENPGLFNNNK